MFSEKESDYLKTQHLARIGTASKNATPDVAPVGFDFDGEYFYVGGMKLLKTKKYKNILENPKVALVIDDLKTVDPWDPRGIKIPGTADIVTRGGNGDSAVCIRIKPEIKMSWGIDEPVFKGGKFNLKKTRMNE